MTAKEYLQQYRNADREINAKLEQIARLRSLATKTTQSISPDRVQSSPENKVERICAKIADLEKEVDTDVDRLVALKHQIEGTIKKVPDGSQRAVLTRRYINGERWEQIAVKLNYHYRWVLELHGRGLEAIKTAL